MPGEFRELHEILAFFAAGLETTDEDLLGMPLTTAEVGAFETRYQFALPYILRAFYLKHNGMGEEVSRGSPHHHIVPLQSLGEVGGIFRNTLYNHADEVQDERKLKRAERDLYEPEPPDALLAIGMDASGDVYFLDLRRRSREGIPVFLLHHDAAFAVDQVAASIESFIFEFLHEKLGDQDHATPSMPVCRPETTDPHALVRDALPLIETAPAKRETLPVVQPRILTELGSTNWRHGSSPEGVSGGILSGFFSSSGRLVTLGRDGEIHTWRVDGTIDRSFRLADECEPDRIVVSPDESKLAVLWKEEYDSDAVNVTILDFANGGELCRFSAEHLIDLQFSADGLECTALSKKGAAFHDTSTGVQKNRCAWKKPLSKHGVFSATKKAFIMDSEGAFPLVIRDSSGRKLTEIERPAGIDEPVIPENEIRQIILGSDDKSVLVFLEGALVVHDLETNATAKGPFPFTESDTNITRSGASSLTAVEYQYRKYSRVGFTAAVLDPETGAVVEEHAFSGSAGNVTGIVSPDRTHIALLCDGDLRVDLRSLPDWKRENAATEPVSDGTLADVTDAGFVFFSGSTVGFTDRDGRLLASRDLSNDLLCASVSADGSVVVVTDTGCHAHVLNLPALDELFAFKVPSFAKAAAFAPQGNRAILGCDNGTLFLLSGGTQKPTKLPQWLHAYTSQIRWSPDGRFVLAADGNKVVLFDVEKRTLVNDRLSQGEYTWAVDFALDGSRILVAGRDVSLRVLEVTGREILRVPDVDVMRAWFMPDGRLLVFQMDGTILLLDGVTGQRVGEFHLRDTADCVSNIIPAPDRKRWYVKSSRGRLLECEL